MSVIQLSAAIAVQGQGDIVDLLSDVDPTADPELRNVIYSEVSASTAPLSFELKTKPDCKPGAYKISLIFTYYNGSEWSSVVTEGQFLIRNVLQRYDRKIAFAALFAALVTIITSISPVLKAVRSLLEWSFPPLFR